MNTVACFLALAIAALAQSNPNSPIYPGAIATDHNLGVAQNTAASTLSAAIDNATLTIPVALGTPFLQYGFISIDSEIMQICSISSNVLTACSRGADGSAAASHSSGRSVRSNINRWYVNQLAAEVKAIETFVGTTAPFSSLDLPFLIASQYNFTPQTPGGSLTASIANTVTLAPGPAGVRGSDSSHQLRIANGVGTAETITITGGTCNGTNQATCTIIFTPGGGHTGAWTIATATAGIQEAISAAAATGATVYVTGQLALTGCIEVFNKAVALLGVSRAATKLTFASGLTCPAIHLVQGGLPYPELSRFELGNMTIVNGSMNRTTISVEGIQSAPNLVHDIYMTGGDKGLTVGSGANDDGFQNITVYDVTTTGIEADLTQGGNHQCDNCVVGTKAGATQFTYGFHIYITSNAGGIGGFFLKGGGVTATPSFGPTTAGLFENTSGTRQPLFIFMTQFTVDGQFAVDGLAFKHIKNLNAVNAWSVSHSAAPAAAWRFQDCDHIQVTGGVAYAEGQGSFSIQDASDNIVITGTSMNTNLGVGTTPAFYFSGTQSTNLVAPNNANKIDNPVITNSNSAYVAATGTAFADLGTPPDGFVKYCTNCTIASPCAGASTGAVAKRINGAWVCN